MLPSSSLYEISCHLSAKPSCGYIRYFRCQYKAVHVLIKVDGGIVTVEVTSLLQLHTLPKMSFDSHSNVSLLWTESLVTLPTIVIIFCILAIVSLLLWQFLKVECHADLVASYRIYQMAYLVEMERSSLNTHRDIPPVLVSLISPNH